MKDDNQSSLRVIIYEGADSIPLADSERLELVSTLLTGGYDVTLANGRGLVRDNHVASLLVLGKFSGDMPAQASDAQGDGQVIFEDVAGLSTQAIVSKVESTVERLGTTSPSGWKPWFPVIDFDRCTNCMQCLSFCLFDVYAVDKQEQITVQNQEKCKTDCPACSRVCPEVAILFPKYGKGPINGDVVRESDIQREAMKIDVSALLGGDIYSSLRSRQSDARKRFSTERDESKALLERKRCLKKLQGDLDIPNEVLMSLPSAGDIQERAERAKAKAVQRLARSQTVKDTRSTATPEEWGI